MLLTSSPADWVDTGHCGSWFIVRYINSLTYIVSSDEVIASCSSKWMITTVGSNTLQDLTGAQTLVYLEQHHNSCCLSVINWLTLCWQLLVSADSSVIQSECIQLRGLHLDAHYGQTWHLSTQLRSGERTGRRLLCSATLLLPTLLSEARF